MLNGMFMEFRLHSLSFHMDVLVTVFNLSPIIRCRFVRPSVLGLAFPERSKHFTLSVTCSSFRSSSAFRSI